MRISTPRVKPVPGGRVRVATAVLAAAVLALVLAGTTATASPDTTTEATASQDATAAAKILPGKRLQELKRVVATKWARDFAVPGSSRPPRSRRSCSRYMRQDLCMRLACIPRLREPIKNCTPVSVAFMRSFADATVEDLIHCERQACHFRGSRVAVKFSNGVLVVFAYDYYGREGWSIGLPNGRFVQAATG